LLIVDVDGVLNPDTQRDNPEPPWITFVAEWSGYVVALNPEHGKELLAIAERTGCELVWGTTWEEHANDEVASRLGLPVLPVVHVTTPPEGLDNWVIWKSGHIAKYAAGRPFVAARLRSRASGRRAADSVTQGSERPVRDKSWAFD
jgi:RNA polymerase subunit RPABC4/transcription elongation factor Spt4